MCNNKGLGMSYRQAMIEAQINQIFAPKPRILSVVVADGISRSARIMDNRDGLFSVVALDHGEPIHLSYNGIKSQQRAIVIADSWILSGHF